MNVFNRVLAILIALLLTVGGLLAALVRIGLLAPTHPALAWLTASPAGAWLEQLARTPAAPTLAIALGVAVLGLLLLWAELRPAPREDRFVLRNDGLGRITIRRASVDRLIAYLAAQTPDILQVRSMIAPSAQGLRVRCQIALRPDANLAESVPRFQQRVKDAIERELGLKVASVTIDTQFEPLPGGLTPAPAPARRQLR
ncbi:alkaline shock response membrane anchor protein AmaP [Kallotenue papyrolyticum]|uniref:alkaline shock response membrane anchor protein AmaP n=1 Tax=Kallotenue papyrolyticum TaxID=1325125 RepID=UPI0004705768|nr:alkaline shock response membrane anchor protein AmaP [Kallotenue papyrolyticum]